jgi:hypothetical protein
MQKLPVKDPENKIITKTGRRIDLQSFWLSIQDILASLRGGGAPSAPAIEHFVDRLN